MRRDGTPYTLRNVDHFRHTVTHEDASVTVTSVREPSGSIAGCTTVRVSFTPRTIGSHTLTFKLNQQRIGGQTYNRLYIAGKHINLLLHHAGKFKIFELYVVNLL